MKEKSADPEEANPNMRFQFFDLEVAPGVSVLKFTFVDIAGNVKIIEQTLNFL